VGCLARDVIGLDASRREEILLVGGYVFPYGLFTFN